MFTYTNAALVCGLAILAFIAWGAVMVLRDKPWR